MVKIVIEALKDRGIAFLVAPYEADAQMAYLALTGEVHAVITEDSDLLVYGVPRVLFKMDRAGQGEEICIQELPRCQGGSISFIGFSHEMFSQMCILSGCDYLDLASIGPKKAHALIKKHLDFVRACRSLRFTGTSIPTDYEQNFQRCLWVFRHQRVYCPKSRSIVHVQPLPTGGIGAANVDVMAAIPCSSLGDSGLDFLGPLINDEIARGIAEGRLDATTKEAFDLSQIYAGCPARFLPRGVAARLQASRPSDEPQEHYPQSNQSRGADGGGRGWIHLGQVGSKSNNSQPLSHQNPSSGKSKTVEKNHKIDHFFKPIPSVYKPFVPPSRHNEGQMILQSHGSKKRLGMQGPALGIDKSRSIFQPQHRNIDSENDLSLTLTDELLENGDREASGWADFQFESKESWDKGRKPLSALPLQTGFGFQRNSGLWGGASNLKSRLSPLPPSLHHSIATDDDAVVPSSYTNSRRKRSRDKEEGLGLGLDGDEDALGGLLGRVRSSLSPIFADLVQSGSHQTNSRKNAQPFSSYACKKDRVQSKGPVPGEGFHDLSHLDDFSLVAHKVMDKMTRGQRGEDNDGFDYREQSMSL